VPYRLQGTPSLSLPGLDADRLPPVGITSSGGAHTSLKEKQTCSKKTDTPEVTWRIYTIVND